MAIISKSENNTSFQEKKLDNGVGSDSDIQSKSGEPMVVGLTNLGNTCYMNTVLQLFFSIPSLLTAIADDEKVTATGIGRELIRLMRRAWTGSYSELNTGPLKHEIGLTFSQYMGYRQHDAHELLIELLNQIHDSLRCLEKPVEDEEGISADSDFEVDTSMVVSGVTRKEDNSLYSGSQPSMNITPPNIPNIVDGENLNSLSLTPQKGRVHENLPINLMEDRHMDNTMHENIYQNISAAKASIHEKEKFSLIPDFRSDQLPDQIRMNFPFVSSSESPDGEESRSVDSNTGLPGASDQPDIVWHEWEQQNSSVITDTFFGQFVTHTTCCHCGHTVVNYAPFNHISLPLPHASDRHIVVTWVPKADRKAHRYLVTVNSYGRVSDLKSALLELVNQDINLADVSVAEVVRSRIHIVHGEETYLKHVKDSRSSVYAYERLVMGGVELNKGSSFQDTNFFSNNLDTDSSLGGRENVMEVNIEVNIDVTGNRKQFKNKLVDTFDLEATSHPIEAKIENKPSVGEDCGELVEWASCVICLEDFPPHLLSSHTNCNMTICQECYESYKASETPTTCPVCKEALGEVRVAGSEQSGSVRWRLTPLNISFNGTEVGHPYLVELPSRLDSTLLLDFLSDLLPLPLPQLGTLSISNVTGDKWVVSPGEEVMLLSSHFLSIELSSYPSSLEDKLSNIIDTDSLKKLELSLKPLELQDCLNAFVKSDELCAGSTWHCALCDSEQSAMTATSISHLPPYLILQLNRFNVLASGLSRTEKITVPVHIPRRDLDLSVMMTSAHARKYSLCGVIHHHGSIGGGHYTAQTLRGETWRHYSDTCVTVREPVTSDNGIPGNDADARSAYVLLYKQNTGDVDEGSL